MKTFFLIQEDIDITRFIQIFHYFWLCFGLFIIIGPGDGWKYVLGVLLVGLVIKNLLEERKR